MDALCYQVTVPSTVPRLWMCVRIVDCSVRSLRTWPITQLGVVEGIRLAHWLPNARMKELTINLNEKMTITVV